MFDLFVFTVNCQSKQYFCNLFNAFCNPLCEFEKITRSSANVKLDITVFSSLSGPQDSSNISCKSFTKQLNKQDLKLTKQLNKQDIT